jgi:hypothetical protein
MNRARVFGSVRLAKTVLMVAMLTNFGSGSGSRSFGISSHGVGALLPSRKW